VQGFSEKSGNARYEVAQRVACVPVSRILFQTFTHQFTRHPRKDAKRAIVREISASARSRFVRFYTGGDNYSSSERLPTETGDDEV
jgi:hypothetical protein